MHFRFFFKNLHHRQRKIEALLSQRFTSLTNADLS